MKTKLLLLAWVAVTTAFAADPAPFQLKGVLDTGGAKVFGLATQTGDRSAWVSLGKQFEGYTLKSYDDAKSVLFFEHEGKTYELSLATAKIAATEATHGTPATIADAAAVIDQMRFEEMIQKTIEGQKKAMAAMSRQMAQRTGAKVSSKDMEEHQAKVMDMMMEAISPAQMKEDITRIYAQTFTKEELKAMGDFNATPAGQAMIEKSPAVQQKLQELMMPRMMAVMPKIQQMGMEFAKQQKEKAAAAKAAAAAEAEPAQAPTTPVAK